uniref:interferon-inducible GTPase 5-like isoform X2 n=1 Tax=Pristiophorus japonicus TaxID=55135 RepID=UPI00398F58BD
MSITQQEVKQNISQKAINLFCCRRKTGQSGQINPEEQQSTRLPARGPLDQMAQSSKSTFFSQKDCKRFTSAYETGGLEGAVSLIQKKVKDLNNVKLDIAVTGESGVGKSSFINAMRGLRRNDKGAAEVGNTETTMEPAPYPHPSLPNVCFWDLPGIGTFNFKADTYLRKMHFERYDFFIIILDCRVKEHDAKLGKKIKRLGKNIYFARSKIDNDLTDIETDGGKSREMKKIRTYCVAELKKFRIPSPTVFLISSHCVKEFDFPTLKETLANNLDDIKKHVFLLSLPNITLEMVENKRKELNKQVWMLATLSGTVGAVPIPGLSLVCDIGILVTAIIQFRLYLGLDDDSLQRLANVAGKSVRDLKAVVKTPLMGEITEEFVKRILLGSTFAAISAAEAILDFIPIIGSIFGAGTSFTMTYKLLNDALDELVENAQRVVKAAFETD